MEKDKMKYRKKPVVIDAIQFIGTNQDEIIEFTKGHALKGLEVLETVKIQTMEGLMTAKRGDWIIKGIKDEYYPCDPDIFAQTYEDANEN